MYFTFLKITFIYKVYSATLKEIKNLLFNLQPQGGDGSFVWFIRLLTSSAKDHLMRVPNNSVPVGNYFYD